MARDPLSHPEEAIRQLYAYVAYRVGDGADAEDIVSDTVERALRYRDSYDSARGSPIAWLIGSARRQIADYHREDKLTSARDEDVPASVELDDAVAQRIDLQRALSALDDRSRDFIALRYGAGLRSREIGRLLDVRPNTVDVSIHRALAQLRAALERPTSLGP